MAISDDRPNIVFIMADDHTAHAVGAYGSRINTTPNIDRIAAEGARLDACFCTNSLCAPSRATILTGTYSHLNGVTTLDTPFDARQPTFRKQAVAWTGKNLDNDAVALIGGMELSLELQEHRLQLYPEG